MLQEPNQYGIADKPTYLAETVSLMQDTSRVDRLVTIVCHGHSVPAGSFEPGNHDPLNAYPYLLNEALIARFPNAEIDVIVTAQSGQEAPTGAERFERLVLSLNPDIITIDYALNDRHRRVGLDKARVAWIDMIEQAKSRGIKVILLTPTGDIRSNMDNPDDYLNLHAEQIRSLAGKYNVALVDNRAVIRDYLNSGRQILQIMSSFVHPNRKGHDLVVKELLEWFPE